MRLFEDTRNGGYHIKMTTEEFKKRLMLFLYMYDLRKYIKLEIMDVDHVDRYAIEDIQKATQAINEKYRATRLHPKNIYESEAEKEECKQILEDFLADCTENAVEYMVMDGFCTVYSYEEEKIAIMKSCQAIVDGLSNMTPAQRRAWQNSLHPERKAPTLGGGYVVLALALFVEGFFFLRWYLWMMTIAIFWVWRKKEQDLYNGRRDD